MPETQRINLCKEVVKTMTALMKEGNDIIMGNGGRFHLAIDLNRCSKVTNQLSDRGL